ncbi:MAG: WD40 repeat domain-containing protein [Chloroflexota bacterium]
MRGLNVYQLPHPQDRIGVSVLSLPDRRERLRLDLPGAFSATLSTDARRVFIVRNLLDGRDQIAVHDGATGRQIRTFEQPFHRPDLVVLSPDGRYLAVNTYNGAQARYGMELYDVRTGRRLGRAHPGRGTAKPWEGDGENGISHFSPDGSVMVTTSAYGDALSSSRDEPAPPSPSGRVGPSRPSLRSAIHGPQLWSTRDLSRLASLERAYNVADSRYVAYSGQRALVALPATDRRTVVVRKEASGEIVKTVAVEGVLDYALFSASGTRLLVRSMDDEHSKQVTTVLYDTRSWRRLESYREPSDWALVLPANRPITVSVSPNGEMLVRSTATGAVLWLARGKPSGVTRVEVSNDGRFLAVTSLRGLELWRIP